MEQLGTLIMHSHHLVDQMKPQLAVKCQWWCCELVKESGANTGASVFVYLSQVMSSSQDWTMLSHIADFSSYCRDPALWHLEAISLWLWYRFHFLFQDDTVPLIRILHNSSYQALYCCVIFILSLLFFIHFYSCVWCYESVPCCLSWAEVKYTNFRKMNVLHAEWLSLHCIS